MIVDKNDVFCEGIYMVEVRAVNGFSNEVQTIDFKVTLKLDPC